MEKAPLSFATLYHRSLNEEREFLQNAILNGGCKDITQYKEMIGKLNGLQAAQARFDELMKKFGEKD